GRGLRQRREENALERRAARLGELPAENLLAEEPRDPLARADPLAVVRLLRGVRLHRVDLALHDGPDVDRRAETVARPALRLHRERLHVLGELRVDAADPVDEVGRGDEAIAPADLPARAQRGLGPRRPSQLHRPQGALAGRDVVGVAVAAVGSPGDDDVWADPPQPADDVAQHRLLADTGQGPIGVLKTGDRLKTHPAAGLGELLRAFGAEPLSRDDRVLGVAHPALIALRQAETVDADALVGVLDERPTDAEGLVVRVREDRAKNERIFHKFRHATTLS